MGALDALLLGAVQRTGAGTALLTFDLRRVQAARALGVVMLGT